MAIAPSSRSHVNTRNAWIFFTVTVLEAITNCALEGVLFYFVIKAGNYHDDDPMARTIPTYLTIYILAFLFQVIFMYLAIRQRNTIQIFGLVLFNATFVVYSAVQIVEIPADTLAAPQKLKPYLILIPVVTGIAQIAYVYLAYLIYKDFGWLVFKRLGADRKIHQYYFYYEIFACLLKFDFFFFVGFSLQLLVLNLKIKDVETWVTIAAIPISIIFIFLAVWSVKHEIGWLQILFDAAIIAGAGYFGFKLWRIWDSNKQDNYTIDRKSLTIFASISVILLFCTLLVSVKCQMNFGKGLRKYLVPHTDKEEQGFMEYDLDEDTGYRSPPLQGGGPRVLLD